MASVNADRWQQIYSNSIFHHCDSSIPIPLVLHNIKFIGRESKEENVPPCHSDSIASEACNFGISHLHKSAHKFEDHNSDHVLADGTEHIEGPVEEEAVHQQPLPAVHIREEAPEEGR